MEIKLEDYDFYIRPGVTDMRKGSTSLAYIVQNEMQLGVIGTRYRFHIVHTNRPNLGVLKGFREMGYQVRNPRFPHSVRVLNKKNR